MRDDEYGTSRKPVYSIGRLPSGEWQVFVDHKSGPVATGFDTTGEAQAWIDEQELPDGQA